MMIDLAPLASVGLELVAAVLMAVGSYAVWRLNRFLGLREDSEVRAYLDGALHQAVEYGLEKAAPAAGKLSVKTRNEVVASAASYAAAAVPDALARFNITPERLGDMIRARLKVHEPRS